MEVENELLPNQSAADRPDLVARVFNLKLWDLLKQIRYKEIFGLWLGWVWTIEYQKFFFCFFIFLNQVRLFY